MMQKPTLDAVQVRHLLDDFLRFLANINLDDIWTDTLEADPNFPMRRRGKRGWRETETETSDSIDSWKQSLFTVSTSVCIEFSQQIAWRFNNVEQFRWMDIIHPSKFGSGRIVSQKTKRELLGEFQKLYPFAFNASSAITVENNLDVLHNNKEICLLLEKVVRERKQAVQKKRSRKQQNEDEFVQMMVQIKNRQMSKNNQEMMMMRSKSRRAMMTF
eukprot:gene13468-14859_t